MTERLTTLLHREADLVEVPRPDAVRILRDGRRLHRHRRVRVGASALLAAAVVAAVAIVATPGSGRDGASHESTFAGPSSAPSTLWAVASGSTVQLGDGTAVTVTGKVKSLYYTSAGVLARTGRGATTDAPDSTYTLLAPTGRGTDFALDLGDRVPGTDPSEPYLAYAEATDSPDRWDVVLRDVRTGKVARSIPVTGAFTWGGWVAPPVALSGSHVYVGMDDATLDVDWETGAVQESTALPASRMPIVDGGRYVREGGNGPSQVLDASTGETLVTAPKNAPLLSLSPDGSHAIALPWRTCDQSGECTFDTPEATVYDLDSGTQATVDLRDASYGWTPEGDLLRVGNGSVDVCAPDTGSCTSTPAEIGLRDLRLGGSLYEA